jgi:hypothetical protein
MPSIATVTVGSIAFSSEADAASPKENASKLWRPEFLLVHRNGEPLRLYVTAMGAPRGAPGAFAMMLAFSF